MPRNNKFLFPLSLPHISSSFMVAFSTLHRCLRPVVTSSDFQLLSFPFCVHATLALFAKLKKKKKNDKYLTCHARYKICSLLMKLTAFFRVGRHAFTANFLPAEYR
ncbi:hypothetical protein PUN28_004130 [Cardiocondyla obscurior]|uniref:Secreted protein n=1 Tax=Cardiocondyla obscurior TaxID=286306 RepID=A0AAW2GPQ1_9HYME